MLLGSATRHLNFVEGSRSRSVVPRCSHYFESVRRKIKIFSRIAGEKAYQESILYGVDLSLHILDIGFDIIGREQAGNFLPERFSCDKFLATQYNLVKVPGGKYICQSMYSSRAPNVNTL